MNDQILISVIVPVYNVEAYLPKCVESILNQTYENLEILLVDDGSKDQGGAICDDYARKDSRIRVIHKPNGGLSSARNAGIDQAHGEYLAFLDSDDWVEPETYESMLELALRKNVKLVCAGRYVVSERKNVRYVDLCPKREEVLSAEEMMGRVFTWMDCDSAAWDKLYHRSLFETIRYPLGVVSEDVATTYKLIELAGSCAMLPRPVYNYNHRMSGSITKASLTEKTFHFEQHTAVIYDYICKNHPAIRDQARFLRVRGLRHSLLSIETADAASREQYQKQMKSARKAMRKHSLFILRCQRFDSREKGANLCLGWGLYRLYRSLRGS